jgi:hypothetical protein
MKYKPGAKYGVCSFEEFKEFTFAVLRGERKLDPDMPKAWYALDPKLRNKAKGSQLRSSRSRSKAKTARTISGK